MLQNQIDSRSQERGREDEQNDLDLERRLVVGVVVHHDAPDVSYALAQAAEAQGDHVGPCFAADAEDELGDGGEAEEGGEEGVGAEAGEVAVDCAFDGAFGAHFYAPVGYFYLGAGCHCYGDGMDSAVMKRMAKLMSSYSEVILVGSNVEGRD